MNKTNWEILKKAIDQVFKNDKDTRLNVEEFSGRFKIKFDVEKNLK